MCVADKINAKSMAGNCGMHAKAVELSAVTITERLFCMAGLLLQLFNIRFIKYLHGTASAVYPFVLPKAASLHEQDVPTWKAASDWHR